jgi:predicted DCC family thiol-disulfide oxidoreductase YuxK
MPCFEVFFDGACRLCSREMRAIEKLDRQRRIRSIDIAAPDFDAGSYGLDYQQLMDRIHGRLPDGTIVEGVEVFRRIYGLLGFGPLVTLTRIPGVSHLLDLAHRVFARNRMRLTGRCEGGACAVPSAPPRTHPSPEQEAGR